MADADRGRDLHPLAHPVGNWIFAAGGDPNAARNVGVPVAAVKIGLFMFTACAATLFACVQVLDAGSADTARGLLKEFEAIIAAVIGGCLLTGGYGSAIGASFGALIFGTVQMGIFYTAGEHRLVQGVPRRDDADRRAVQQLHPAQGHRGPLTAEETRMTVRRIVANLAAEDPGPTRSFYERLLDLEVVMDHGWIVTLAADARAAPQLSIASEGGSGTPVPGLSIEVDDVDRIYARNRRRLRHRL